jgi:hypothetical protein
MNKYSDGDIVYRDGIPLKITIERDDFFGQPWKEWDGSGIVSEWTHRDKRPGELILHKDGEYRLFYDFAATIKLARREGWGCSGNFPTKRAEVAAAVRRDYEYLRRWCNDDWWWCWVKVTPCHEDRDGRLIEYDDLADSCGGVCSDDTDDMVEQEINNVLMSFNTRLIYPCYEELGDCPDLIRLAA